jgi:hypothetical protein
LGRTPVLRLTGRLGQAEREGYLGALAAALSTGDCTRDEAVAELHELSEPWIREVVRARVRRLPAHADPQTTEHWLWMEWHGALRQFDPARVESFPAYVALRLRMAVAAAAREDDPLPRKARERVRTLEHVEGGLVQHLGRPLTAMEHAQLAQSILGEWETLIRARVAMAELPAEDLVSAEPDPAAAVERMWLRGAVREALASGAHRRPGGLLAWLEQAESHDRAPSLRMANVPRPVRALLAAWVADDPDRDDSSAA